MASGLPDYYSGVRPKKGLPMIATGNKVGAPLGYTTLLAISGKGFVYGGAVFLNHALTQRNSEVLLKVDGNNMLSMSFNNMALLGINLVGIYPTVLRLYDDVNFIYCVGLGYGVTFEKGISIVYNELHGSGPTVFAEIMYALS